MNPAAPRFWLKVDKAGPVPEHRPDLGPCWLWTGADSGRGYGRLGVNGRLVYAHRFAYELLVGPIPAGMQIDHLCRVHSCVRPDHLEIVTNAENTRRGIGQPSAHLTHCQRGHPFDTANTGISSQGRRFCRACQRRSDRAYRERKAATA